VQNYVDVDPGPDARDFTCGSLTYDGHAGTGIRLATRAEMTAGVAVVAAAAGRVIHSRDGMPDQGIGGDAIAEERELDRPGVDPHMEDEKLLGYSLGREPLLQGDLEPGEGRVGLWILEVVRETLPNQARERVAQLRGGHATRGTGVAHLLPDGVEIRKAVHR